VELNQEEGTGLPDHYMYKLTGMLALGGTLKRQDPTLTGKKLNEHHKLRRSSRPRLPHRKGIEPRSQRHGGLFSGGVQ